MLLTSPELHNSVSISSFVLSHSVLLLLPAALSLSNCETIHARLRTTTVKATYVVLCFIMYRNLIKIIIISLGFQTETSYDQFMP
ncbi:hypothetical protein POTOM_050896 [Populus tomentosa]|uniref:Uncharacterized protein n=1 Tax=Populus tomentosa TaxID=118781 RepID=A0A8X7Y923_POPTO|nr:hypothetical protein POTOM_050896 [Populus tomentosa]